MWQIELNTNSAGAGGRHAPATARTGILFIACAVFAGGVLATAAPAASVEREFHDRIQPVFQQYCHECHGEKKKGGLDLRKFASAADLLKDRKHAERILHNLRSREMPPQGRSQPSLDDRERVAAWLQTTLFPLDCRHPDPGRVTIRRLNRVEYANTIRDLLGVEPPPADDFPPDDSGYGFDNIGDVLSLSPVLFEKYFQAAENILSRAIVADPTRHGPVTNVPAARLEPSKSGNPYGQDAVILSSEGELVWKPALPAAGRCVLRVKAWAQPAGPEPACLEVRLNGAAVKRFDVRATENAPENYELELDAPAGGAQLAFAFVNDYYNPNDPDPQNRDRNLILESVQFAGPFGAAPLPESHRRIFFRSPAAGRETATARELIGKFAPRAWRRPVSAAELDRLLALCTRARAAGGTFEHGVRTALLAVLASPHFLFLGESDARVARNAAVEALEDFTLASRLSYFLWSTMPDAELFALAEQGKLRKRLPAQAARMLRDPRARALVENFAGQWLQLRNLKLMAPDPKEFPAFDEALRSAMQRETELFVEAMIREDRSVMDFLDADFTFVNERLARHYGIEGVSGPEFRRVKLTDARRRGVLTQASVLTLTSNPTRTSPVKRGKWVLENLLGTPPPPPPPNVPELKNTQDAVLSGPLRQRLEQHRSDPNCMPCHARMDPIGFGLENFDGIGAWRERDGNFPIDAAGQLVSGEAFNGVEDLRGVLRARKREEFVRCLTRKLLTYALGRGLEYYDQCAVDEILRKLARADFRFSALVTGIVESAPFRLRRGAAGSNAAAESSVLPWARADAR